MALLPRWLKFRGLDVLYEVARQRQLMNFTLQRVFPRGRSQSFWTCSKKRHTSHHY